MRPKGDNSEHSDEDEVFLKKVMAVIESNISNPDLSVEMIALDVGFSATPSAYAANGAIDNTIPSPQNP